MQKLIISTVKQLTIDRVPSTFPMHVPTLPQIGSDWPPTLSLQLLCEVTAKTPKSLVKCDVMLLRGLSYIVLPAFVFYIASSLESNRISNKSLKIRA